MTNADSINKFQAPQRYSLPKPETRKMKELCSDGVYGIPAYQRGYSWDNVNAEELFHDIIQVMRGVQPTHFFGCIVTYLTKKNVQMLIDGQQRLSTSMVMIGIIRDLAHQLRLSIPKNRVSNELMVNTKLFNIETQANQYLFGTNKYANNSILTLALPKYDSSNGEKQNYKKYFEGLIIKNGTATKYEDPNYRPIKLLRMVYRKLRHELTHLLRKSNGADAKVDTLSRFFRAFMNRFYVIVMEAPTHTDAITIYTTLNARGVSLQPCDIIKGQLASTLEDNGKSISKAMTVWNRMSKELSGNANEISKFLQQYWTAKYGYQSTADLSQDLVHHIKSPKDVWIMLHDLAELAPVYKTLKGMASTSRSVFQSPEINDRIMVLNDMGLVQYIPVILALYHKGYNEHDILIMLKDVERIEMRHIVQHIAHTKYGDESHLIWTNDWNINQIVIDLNSKQLSDETRTKAACSTYQHKYTKSGHSLNVLLFMISKIYSLKNGDFDYGNSIYHDIFMDKDYTVLRLTHNNVNNNLDNMGNWTIIEHDLGQEANSNRNTTSLYNALKQSSLNSNKKLAKLLNSKEYANNLTKLVSDRQDSFAKYYVKVW